MKKRKNVSQNIAKPGGLAKSVMIGACVGIIVWTVLMFLCAFIISGHKTPEIFIYPCVFILCALSSCVSGIVSTSLIHNKTLLSGVLSGVVLLLVVTVISLASGDKNADSSIIIKILLGGVFLLFSLLGARLAMPSGKKRGGYKR